MAILVRIKKIKSTPTSVTYSFVSEKGSEGKFAVNSQTGDLKLISSMPDDNRKLYFARAARKVMTEWQAKGTLPDQTFWAS
ncbi:hypothetical protein HIK07_12800 [Cronobacter sakazakii]|uniref:Uncharacterized protein n=3 Tax=Enterobacteriaceae TaxID=543 RepID=A0AAC8ZRI3_9ENTR|nr:hypothetical protein [Cronobacter sakazakii]ALB54862.1 hypothetical protein AFK65_09365 [Cronobacter universalis NCTC 9529]ELY5933908.1 hypothetical protein [Cronobacter malonaticus]EIZ8957633.1 hypothetical protein [Cronobacter sakazakii]EIZ8958211.1 hypothetical protein [Cronobacter sakazakii]MBF4650155.1 hypothetical protein [Cronobacter sakazakii]